MPADVEAVPGSDGMEIRGGERLLEIPEAQVAYDRLIVEVSILTLSFSVPVLP